MKKKEVNYKEELIKEKMLRLRDQVQFLIDMIKLIEQKEKEVKPCSDG